MHPPETLLKLVAVICLAGNSAIVTEASEAGDGLGPIAESIAGEFIALDPIVVVASKLPQPLSQVAAQVTVIDAEAIRQRLVENVDDLLRLEPGLELEGAGTRFGASALNIRGIGGNRVAIEIDGIPLGDRVAVGAFSDSGRSFVETDRIKRVEVLHGPASVLYGSSALGGIVAVTTLDPQDVADGVSLRTGWQGSSEAWVGSAVGGWLSGQHGLLLGATWREGHELNNQAPTDFPDDPQHWDQQDVMLRYTYDTPSGNLVRLSASGRKRNTDTEIRSLLGYGRRFGTTTELSGADQEDEFRVSADYEFSWAGWQQGVWRVFHSEWETEQQTREVRGSARLPVRIEREFHYRQQRDGLELSLFRELSAATIDHRLGFGLEWLQTHSREFRDGLQTNLDTGVSSNVILGEVMPVRDFPNSRSREFGLFAQDEMQFGDGLWQLTTALRWDRYELAANPDALWLEDYPDFEIVDVRDGQFTPRVALLRQLGQGWSAYGQYSAGFRAPPFEDINVGLFIPLFNYRAIPNPDLQAETSDGFELGVRHSQPNSHVSLALFHTDYDQFIESRALIGTDPVSGETLFQSRNIESARIYGVDLRYDLDLAALGDRLQYWRLRLAGYWSKGENRETDQPLNSIAPPQAVLALRWQPQSAGVDLELSSTWTARKSDSDIDSTEGQRFATGSWLLFDITAGWQLSASLELRLGIYNLSDQRYWRWLDVASFEASDPMIPLLARPGRNYSLSLRFTL